MKNTRINPSLAACAAAAAIMHCHVLASGDTTAEITTGLSAATSWRNGFVPAMLSLNVATRDAAATEANAVAAGGNSGVDGADTARSGGAVDVPNPVGSVLQAQTLGSGIVPVSPLTHNDSIQGADFRADQDGAGRTVVPEVGAALLGGIGMLLLLRRRR